MNGQIQNNSPAEDHPEGTLPPTPDQQPPNSQSTSRFKLTWKFAAGFLGWYLVIWLIYWSLSHGNPDPQGYGAMIVSMLVFPAQIIALIFLFVVKKFRKIGWGMLSAIASNLMISLLLGFGFNAVCFVPFFFQEF
jgi:hypothetical protein